jgi:hypothetical protein
MSNIPPFYITQTLLGFGGGKDLNRITLKLPGDRDFVLCEMNEDRSQVDIVRWNKLAQTLSVMWNDRPAPPREA